MKHQALNPYLPSWEYTPDCEPHVFGDRLYVFGSHDAAGGERYCVGDYVSWSAPVEDLTSWRYEGVIFTRWDDPTNTGHATYSAPDVCQGPDGRFYLYYFWAGGPSIGVAVCDEPAGHYRYLGNVRIPDGRPLGAGLGRGACFDPDVYVEGADVYLYYGFGARPSDGGSFNPPAEFFEGGYVARLAPDMVTMEEEPRRTAPGPKDAAGTSFEAHPFLEASSFRRIRGRYYLIYSSSQGHELCWARAMSPLGPFSYGGVVISNGDVGLHGISEEKDAVYYLGNNHGSLVEVGGKTYVFYHRHTHGTQFSRQDCAEEVHIAEDGSIPQVEVTSCGLNGGPLDAGHELPAYACCHLRSAEGVLHFSNHVRWSEAHPYVTQDASDGAPTGSRGYVANLRNAAEVGYKYLAFSGRERGVELELRGGLVGEVSVRIDAPDGPEAACVAVAPDEVWHLVTASLSEPVTGTHAVYLVTQGEGALDLMGLRFA